VWRIAPCTKDGHVGGAAADVHQADADVLLVLGQHGIARSQRLQHQVDHFEAAAMHALDDVLHRSDGARHQVHLDVEPLGIHADRFLDAVLAVDDELLHQRVQNLVIGRNRCRVGRLDGALDVELGDFLLAHHGHARGILALDVAAGDAGIHLAHLAAGHHFDLGDRARNRIHGGFDIDHHAALEAARFLGAQPEYAQPPLGIEFANDGDDLGGADVEADDQVTFGFFAHQLLLALRAKPLG
jgi:hypothetical protein